MAKSQTACEGDCVKSEFLKPYISPYSKGVAGYGSGGRIADGRRWLADFVDQRMSEVAKTSTVASTAKVAILAAVNIADELFREQQKRLEAMATLEDRSVQIAGMLSREVGEDGARDNGGDSLPGT